MKKLLTICLSILCAAPAVMAEAGRTGGSILSRNLGGRSNGMGQAFTALEGDIENISYNPAGLAFIDRTVVGMSYLRGYASDNNGLMAASIRVMGVNLTPAVLYYNSGNIAWKNSVTGNVRNVTAEQDTVGMLGLSFRPLAKLGVGGTVKYAKFNLAEDAHASGMFYDLGALFVADNGMKLGVAQQNMGPDIKFEDAGDPPPATTRAGAAYTYKISNAGASEDMDIVSSELTLSADWVDVKHEGSYTQCGAEVTLLTLAGIRAAFRGGYMFSRDVDGLTLGAGAEQGNIGLNYAFGNSSVMSNRHQFTLSYKFGGARVADKTESVKITQPGIIRSDNPNPEPAEDSAIIVVP